MGCAAMGVLLVDGFDDVVVGRGEWVSAIDRYVSVPRCAPSAPVCARPGLTRWGRAGMPLDVFVAGQRSARPKVQTHRVLLAGCRRVRPARVEQRGPSGSPASGANLRENPRVRRSAGTRFLGPSKVDEVRRKQCRVLGRRRIQLAAEERLPGRGPSGNHHRAGVTGCRYFHHAAGVHLRRLGSRLV